MNNTFKTLVTLAIGTVASTFSNEAFSQDYRGAAETNRVIAQWTLVEKTHIDTQRVTTPVENYCQERRWVLTPSGWQQQITNRELQSWEQHNIPVLHAQQEWQYQQFAQQNPINCEPRQQTMPRPTRHRDPLCEFIGGALSFPGQFLGDLTGCNRNRRVEQVPRYISPPPRQQAPIMPQQQWPQPQTYQFQGQAYQFQGNFQGNFSGVAVPAN